MNIEHETNNLLNDFTKSANGLFEISSRYIKIFEQGTYGCAIAKPSKRIKNSLAIDREVLVVVTTFKDQQQRTIKFLLQEIHESLGRLETTLVVVLHKDRDGNSKLKNWGRDSGLSVLPLLEGESIESTAALEKSLCIELYSHDPFDVTGPVSDDANFFGRRDEAIDLARKLQKGQIRSCLGIRKIGKTSILNRVLHEIKTAHDCICIMVDCSRDDIWQLNAAQLLESIAQTTEIARVNNLNYSKLAVTCNNNPIPDSRKILETSLGLSNKTIILVFDEIDYITPGSPTNNSWKSEFNIFWRNLRAVYQESARENNKFSVLVAGVSAHWFSIESIDGIENSVLAFIPEEYLSPMPLGASIAMLKRLGKSAGLHFDDESAEKIAKATGNMPYWSRKCASYINRKILVADRPLEVKVERIESMISAFVLEEGAAIAQVALRHLFRVFPDLYDAALSCHNGEGALVPEGMKRILRRYGVLDEHSFSLSGEMMVSGFSALATQPSTMSSSIPTSVNTSSNDLGINEWAEEMAAISRRRNLLERKLRELSLNFLRFQSLESGRVSDLVTRINSVLPQKQRESITHLSAEDSINKFLWSDLVKLLAKEWALFEKMFGAKDEFINHCNIINDRFDAHAKQVDGADFALYRRSLKYLEDRLAKIQ